MFTKSVSATIVAVAATLVSAQTTTSCDPLLRTCPPNPALGRNRIDCDFTRGPCSAFFNLAGTEIDYDESGAVFTISNENQAPTIETHDHIFFGRVEVELQGAPGQGVVTSSVLQSSNRDEIDWEMVGADLQRVQSNYFGKGDDTTYDRGKYHDVADVLTTTHTYTLEWTAEKTDWIVDGVVIRTLRYDEARGGSRYPQTPMKIKLGTWVGGREGAPQGTIDWAGGLTDFSQAPFVARYKRISIVDYAGGSRPATDDIKEYVYGDRSGSWESIRVVKADGSSNEPSGPPEPSPSSTTTPSTSPSPTKTSTTKTTTTKSEPKTSTTQVSSDISTTTELETTSDSTFTTFTTHTTDTSSTTAPPPTTTPGGNGSSGNVQEPPANDDNPDSSSARDAVSGRTLALIATIFMIVQLL